MVVGRDQALAVWSSSSWAPPRRRRRNHSEHDGGSERQLWHTADRADTNPPCHGRTQRSRGRCPHHPAAGRRRGHPRPDARRGDREHRGEGLLPDQLQRDRPPGRGHLGHHPAPVRHARAAAARGHRPALARPRGRGRDRAGRGRHPGRSSPVRARGVGAALRAPVAPRPPADRARPDPRPQRVGRGAHLGAPPRDGAGARVAAAVRAGARRGGLRPGPRHLRVPHPARISRARTCWRPPSAARRRAWASATCS